MLKIVWIKWNYQPGSENWGELFEQATVGCKYKDLGIISKILIDPPRDNCDRYLYQIFFKSKGKLLEVFNPHEVYWEK